MGFRPQLDNLDRGLLDFYERAFCTGRTLLDTNAYLDIMTMAEADEGVRCSALALAASYLLDYVTENLSIRSRANSHYTRAVALLTQRLSDPSVRVPGREDSTVGSLILLFSDDIVNWELRQACDRNPRWRQGSRIARKILDASDPGHRYWDVHNVQSTQIRASNANMVAYTEICALPVTPLEIEDHDRLFPWLLGGIERDVKRIHGGTGVSPKLLHTIAQITQLAAKLHKTPNAIGLRLAAEELGRRLNTFRQWSELSEGFASAQELLDACVLDDHGLVDDAAMVTDLTGETWVQAAKIYLYCRFYRLPRNHSKVQDSLRLLLRCLKCMPTKGKLFTAQSPFFCVFLAAMVAYQAADRQIVQTWFEAVARASGTRSSVPPIWRVVQEYWAWADNDPLPAHVDKIETTVPLGRRIAWWETIVDRFMRNEGQLSLV